MHYSAHGHTAAEIIYTRADAEKDFMGLTTWTGRFPQKKDAAFAKNYLSSDEMDTLNRIVSLYLDFAELQAKSHIPMYMADWIKKLDDFLKLSGKELLTHAGAVSAEVAQKKSSCGVRQVQRENPAATLTCRNSFSGIVRRSQKTSAIKPPSLRRQAQ